MHTMTIRTHTSSATWYLISDGNPRPSKKHILRLSIYLNSFPSPDSPSYIDLYPSLAPTNTYTYIHVYNFAT